MNLKQLFNSFEILKPSNQQKYIVIGDDLDSYLSAAIFIKNNPQSKIIGFYEKYTKLYIHKNYKDFLPNTLWLDLDIYSEHCRSLGHHIIRINDSDILLNFNNSLNLNSLRNVDLKKFKNKYPLGTIHFLISIYNENYEFDSEKELLIWLADSSYINGQSHRFRENVSDWLQYLNNPLLIETHKRIDTIDFEKKIGHLYNKLQQLGFKQGYGQVSSKHLHLSGYQFQCFFKDETYLKKISSLIEDNFDGISLIDSFYERSKFVCIEGIRQTMAIEVIQKRYQTLETFLNQLKVFSYVFPSRKKINFTIGIEL